MLGVANLIAIVVTVTAPSATTTVAPDNQKSAYQELVRQAQEQRERFGCEKSRRLVDEALKLQPDGAEALLERGYCARDNDAAMPDYKRVLALRPDWPEGTLNIGRRIAGTNFEEGLRLIERAMQLKPKWAEAFFARGEVNLLFSKANDREKKALVDFEKAIKLNPKFGPAYNRRGLYRLDVACDFKGALADFERASQLIDPAIDTSQLWNRATAKRFLGKYVDAIADYDALIAKFPKAPNAYWERGQAKQKVGKLEDARRDLDKATELDEYYGSPVMEKMNEISDQKDRCRAKKKTKKK